jgi:hypothetical protein
MNMFRKLLQFMRGDRLEGSEAADFSIGRQKMRIHFVRTGGFAGMRLANTIDSEELPEEEIQALVSELDNANFFELPQFLSGGQGGADRFQYEITVDDGRQKHTVAAAESSLPGNVQPLVQHLERLARTNKK